MVSARHLCHELEPRKIVERNFDLVSSNSELRRKLTLNLSGDAAPFLLCTLKNCRVQWIKLFSRFEN